MVLVSCPQVEMRAGGLADGKSDSVMESTLLCGALVYPGVETASDLQLIFQFIH